MPTTTQPYGPWSRYRPAIRISGWRRRGTRAYARRGPGIKGDFKRAEFVSLPLTVLILLVRVRVAVAMGIPLLLAVTTVAARSGSCR